uniref:Copine family member IX n=1 Tax=Echeneis naucrates TaxID=173247 RepID=A0A665TD28_ECHNA
MPLCLSLALCLLWSLNCYIAGRFTICHKTEVIKNTLNPVWQPFTIPVRALCNGDYDRTVKVDVYDWDRDGSHDFIGEFTTSYRELSRGQNQFNVYEVLNPKKKSKKKKYINSGTVTLLSFKVESEYTFVDFIRGGTQLNFTVAIDFTASNGNPSQPTSLHYMSPYQMNAYAMALKAVALTDLCVTRTLLVIGSLKKQCRHYLKTF